jgi:hypothetical protein
VSVQPGNCEALRYVVSLSQELGRLAEVEQYTEMLRRAERAEVSSICIYAAMVQDQFVEIAVV